MNRPLAIGVVCYPSLGGSGVVAVDIAAGLARRGHDVHVIASAPPSRALPDDARLTFHRVNVSDYPLFDHPPYALAVAATIVEVASAQRLDLVHAHYAVPHAASAYLARQTLGAAAPRSVTTLHGTDVTRLGMDPGYRAVTRFTVAAADAVTAPSAYLRDAARRLLDLQEDTAIEIIPNFVDTERFAPPPRRERGRLLELFAPAGAPADGPVLFHVSNFRAVKRVLDLVEVLARLRRSVAARLVLIGDGPERAALSRRAEELGVADSICFLGERGEFADLLRHADAFVLPSEDESFGVAALEALSCGVPVFGYRVGGLPEVIAADSGVLVEPFDVAALADTLLVALTDPGRRDALGAAARARVLTHFRAAPALDLYERTYRRVLEAQL